MNTESGLTCRSHVRTHEPRVNPLPCSCELCSAPIADFYQVPFPVPFPKNHFVLFSFPKYVQMFNTEEKSLYPLFDNKILLSCSLIFGKDFFFSLSESFHYVLAAKDWVMLCMRLCHRPLLQLLPHPNSCAHSTAFCRRQHWSAVARSAPAAASSHGLR